MRAPISSLLRLNCGNVNLIALASASLLRLRPICFYSCDISAFPPFVSSHVFSTAIIGIVEGSSAERAHPSRFRDKRKPSSFRAGTTAACFASCIRVAACCRRRWGWRLRSSRAASRAASFSVAVARVPAILACCLKKIPAVQKLTQLGFLICLSCMKTKRSNPSPEIPSKM